MTNAVTDVGKSAAEQRTPVGKQLAADIPPYLSVVLPTFNEAQNLSVIVRELVAVLSEAGCRFEIIVVDDNSPDGTGVVAQDLANQYPGMVRVIHRIAARGLSGAVAAGWQQACGNVLAVMDADGQHPPTLLPRILNAIRLGADIAIASRFASGGAIPRWALPRRLLSRVSTLTVRLMLPGTTSGISDPLSGCFAIRRSGLDGLELPPQGFRVLLEVLAHGHFKVVSEIGYVFRERCSGHSKLGVSIAFSDAVRLLQLSWRTKNLAGFARFCGVGLSGVGVNLMLLALLREIGHVSLASAGAFAAGGAILSNFVLNELWTFGDWSRSRPRPAQRTLRLCRYLVICSAGALINVSTLLLINRLLGFHYLVSALGGIGLAVLWNYGWNANCPWQPNPHRR
ncbi:MAG: glycosyltransferase [bacterium]